MSNEASPESNLVGYVYKLTTVLSEGQHLEVTGNLALNAEIVDMNKQFDKLLTVTNRLSAKHKVAKKKADIAADEAMIAAMTSDLVALDAKHEGKKLPTAEQNNREAMVRNIRHLEGRVAGYYEDLKALEVEAT